MRNRLTAFIVTFMATRVQNSTENYTAFQKFLINSVFPVKNAVTLYLNQYLN